VGLKSQPHPPAGECECPPRKSRGFRGISSPAKRAAVFHDPLDFLFERVVNIRLSERHIYADFEPRSQPSPLTHLKKIQKLFRFDLACRNIVNNICFGCCFTGRRKNRGGVLQFTVAVRSAPLMTSTLFGGKSHERKSGQFSVARNGPCPSPSKKLAWVEHR